MDDTKDISEQIANAKKIPDIVKGPKASGFYVRPGTVAICRWIIGGGEPSAVLCHALLELWVETKDKIIRPHNGKPRRFLFLSGDDLATLTGRDKRSLQDHAIPELREHPMFQVGLGRLSPKHPNRYTISIDTTAMWEEVAFKLYPVKETTQLVDGYTFVKKQIDPAKLPYLFKRLYADYVHHNGEFSP